MKSCLCNHRFDQHRRASLRCTVLGCHCTLFEWDPIGPEPRAAASALPWLWATLSEWTEGPLYDSERGNKCQQAGCREPAEVTYRLKREWSERGEGPLPPSPFTQLRRFCSAHAIRGDAAFEDADENYERVSGPPADRSNIPPEDVSAAQRVDLKLGSIDELPEAIKKLHKEL